VVATNHSAGAAFFRYRNSFDPNDNFDTPQLATGLIVIGSSVVYGIWEWLSKKARNLNCRACCLHLQIRAIRSRKWSLSQGSIPAMVWLGSHGRRHVALAIFMGLVICSDSRLNSDRTLWSAPRGPPPSSNSAPLGPFAAGLFLRLNVGHAHHVLSTHPVQQ
jgi:hypothetical protein